MYINNQTAEEGMDPIAPTGKPFAGFYRNYVVLVPTENRIECGHQGRRRPAKLSPHSPAPRIQQFSPTAYSSLPLSGTMGSCIYGTFKTHRSNERHGRINKYTPTLESKNERKKKKLESEKTRKKRDDFLSKDFKLTL